MGDDLEKQLDKIKLSLNKELAQLDADEAEIERGQVAPCTREQYAAFEQKACETMKKQLLVKEKLNREAFLRNGHARSLVPSVCFICFVDHGQESLMNEVESERGDGIMQLECAKQKHVMHIRRPVQ